MFIVLRRHCKRKNDACSFNMWLAPRAGKMNQILRCDCLPELARWGYLARSELLAVSRKKISPKVMSYINPLLTKLVRSRWVDIGLVLFFLRVHGPRFRLGQLQRKRYHFGYYPAILTIRLVNMAVSQKDWELQNSRI